MTRMKCVALLICLVILAGCGPKTHYAWNNYDTDLYDYYKDPTKKDEFAQTLKEILEDAEPENRVPPGIYAEYGFLMYEKGDIAQAILYYQKESDKWPESKPLMAKMISTAQKRSAKKEENSMRNPGTLASESKENVNVEVVK